MYVSWYHDIYSNTRNYYNKSTRLNEKKELDVYINLTKLYFLS